ncbi:MAG: hypothetical protein K0U37_09405 [Gammaproteobacteria bacterium]|nr:hypothetical protein [Gammaproteobacteria bacterium]
MPLNNEIAAAKLIQNRFRLWKMNHAEQAAHNTAPKRPVLSPSEIQDRFKNLKIIGGGGQGIVLEVLDKKTNTHKAYKVADRGISFSLELILNALIDSGYTPHLTHLEECFTSISLPVSLWGYPQNNRNHPEYALVRPVISEQELSDLDEVTRKTIYPSGAAEPPQNINVTLMEILEGDLRRYGYTLAQKIQLMSVLNILSVCGVKVEDQKPKNVFFKKLSSEDTFQGECLENFDFWLYRLGEEHFYIPKQEILIKLGDYDPWSCSAHDKKDITEEEMRTLLRNVSNILTFPKLKYPFMEKGEIEEARQLFSTPPPPGKTVLNMMQGIEKLKESVDVLGEKVDEHQSPNPFQTVT